MANLVIQETLVDKVNEAGKKIGVVEIGQTFKKLADLTNGLPAYVNQIWAEHVGKLANKNYNAGDGTTKVMVQVDKKVSDIGQALWNFTIAYQKGVKQAGRGSEEIEKALDEAKGALKEANELLATYKKIGTPEELQDILQDIGKYQLVGSLDEVTKYVPLGKECEKDHADHEVLKAAANRCAVSHKNYDALEAKAEACEREHADYDALKAIKDRIEAIKQTVADHIPAYKDVSTKEFDKLIT